MSNKLIVATGNAGKLREIKAILTEFKVLGLKDVGIDCFFEKMLIPNQAD